MFEPNDISVALARIIYLFFFGLKSSIRYHKKIEQAYIEL